MKRSKSMVGFLVVQAILSGSGSALADSYDAALVRAVAAKERALESNDPARWDDALLRFEEARRIRETKETAYELGVAASRLRQDDLAVESYEVAVDLGLDGGALEKARRFLAEHRSKMGRLAVRGPTGTQIWVGRRLRGTLPLSRPLVLFPGKQLIRTKSNEGDRSHHVDIEAGAEAALVLSTTPPAPSPPLRQSRQRPNDELPTSRAAPDTRMPSGLRDPDNSVAWGGIGAGATLAVLGGALVVGSTFALNARRGELAALCEVPDGQDDCTYAQPGQQQEAQSKVNAIATTKAFRTGGWIGLGIGSALAGAGGLMLMNGDGSDDAHPSASWTVSLQPDLVSVAVRGPLP
jgi:hypothetical protein